MQWLSASGMSWERGLNERDSSIGSETGQTDAHTGCFDFIIDGHYPRIPFVHGDGEGAIGKEEDLCRRMNAQCMSG